MTNETGAPGVVKCGICRHEMVQCDNGGFVCDHCCHEYDETCECAACLGLRINDRNEAELAAIKSAPGMAEVDAMERELLDEIPSWSQRTSIELLANLARRSIAAREEVVGLLKRADSYNLFGEIRHMAVYPGDKPSDVVAVSREILEIVGGAK